LLDTNVIFSQMRNKQQPVSLAETAWLGSVYHFSLIGCW